MRHTPSLQGDLLFFEETARFLGSCSVDQIRRAPGCFASLCSFFRAHAIRLDQAKRAICPLLKAISAICHAPGSICPAHSDLFQVCLLTKCYSAAAPLLVEYPVAVDPKATHVTATDVLLYCYYGGMVLTGLRQYVRAQNLYLAAITAPTQVLNAITVACLKKYTLVSLIVSGKVEALPNYVSPPVLRALKGECAPYSELARLVSAGTDAAATAQLTEFAIGRHEIWRADGNAGLVQLVISSKFCRGVKSLTETYSTLSTTRMADLVGLPDAASVQEQILRMVDSGNLHACIDERQGIVSFLEDPEGFSSKDSWARLDGLIQRCMEVSSAVAEADHAVSCDKTFLNKMEVAHGVRNPGIPGSLDIEAVRSTGALADLDDAADDLFTAD